MRDQTKSEIVQTVFRGLLSLIFLVAGIQHLLNPDHVALRISKTSWAEPLMAIMPLNIHAFLAGIVLVLGGLGLFFGSKTRLSALGLMAVLIPITVTVQTDSAETLGPLFKNIAIFGALVYFAHFGIGQGFGIDRISLKGRPVSSYFSIVKILFVTVFVGFLAPSLFYAGASEAVIKKSDKKPVGQDIVILVQKRRHLEVAIETLRQGQSADQNPRVRNGAIIVCGKEAMSALTKNSQSEEKVKQGHQAGLKIIACGLSLKEAGLNRENLLNEIAVVENGLWEVIRLQSSGYVSVEL